MKRYDGSANSRPDSRRPRRLPTAIKVMAPMQSQTR